MELDSNANMPVVGKYEYFTSDTAQIADVNPFKPDYQPMQIFIVDDAIQYDCPYSSVSYILVIRNALHIPSMIINLLPPFILIGAGVRVSDTPKIHMDHPTVDDHLIYFPETSFRILL